MCVSVHSVYTHTLVAMWSNFVKRWSGIPLGYNIVSGGEEEVEDLVTQEHTCNSLAMMAVCQTNSVMSQNDDRFVGMGVTDGVVEGRSGVEETDLCSRDHMARRTQAEAKRTAMKSNRTSKLGVPAQQFAAAQKQAGLVTQRKGSGEGIPRNGSICVSKATAGEDGGVARRAQSFSVRRGPTTQTGSRLVQPGFKTGNKQYSAAGGMRPAKGADTGSLGSLVSSASGGSGDTSNRALQFVEGHFSAEPFPSELSRAGHKMPSFRSKSVGRGTTKTADKGSSAKSTGDNVRRPQQQRQCHSDNECTAVKPAPGRDRARAPTKEATSGNKTGRSGELHVVGNATGMVVACCCAWSLLCTQVFQFVQSYLRFRALHLCLFNTHTPSLLHCNAQSTFVFSNSLLVCECSGHVVYREVCGVCEGGGENAEDRTPAHA